MTEYMITIKDWTFADWTYIRKSKHKNFFEALNDDLSDILELINDDDCLEYTYDVI